MPKDLNVSRLCDVYGELLTENMREAVISYYDYDFSLAEIAEQKGVTRQAVLAMLKQAESKLNEFEAVVGAVRKTDRLVKDLQAVSARWDTDGKAAKAMLDGIISELSER